MAKAWSRGGQHRADQPPVHVPHDPGRARNAPPSGIRPTSSLHLQANKSGCWRGQIFMSYISFPYISKNIDQKKEKKTDTQFVLFYYVLVFMKFPQRSDGDETRCHTKPAEAEPPHNHPLPQTRGKPPLPDAGSAPMRSRKAVILALRRSVVSHIRRRAPPRGT